MLTFDSICRQKTANAVLLLFADSVYIIRICSSNQNTGGHKDENYHNEAGRPREARKECQNTYGTAAEGVPEKYISTLRNRQFRIK